MQKQVVEYQGVPVGIVIPDQNRLRFIAVKYHVIGLDNQHFHSVQDVQRAIRAHLNHAPRFAA
ncbi:hypothetical protein NOF55_01095 [Rhizobiaceae bacterium BDR2-2]|uniref:Uncharacterized protein n=1 Tax=Ectorhizobium quercum TaxID=2965071 RepID=A0AAE3MX34_9HYPH|nr:hypothetical protein [Ectorhizobium quercum]MCX8995699.1 hypothetical protein [Ectorhizobium quercum]